MLKDIIKKMKDNQQPKEWKEILQIIHMMRDLYQEFVKNS